MSSYHTLKVLSKDQLNYTHVAIIILASPPVFVLKANRLKAPEPFHSFHFTAGDHAFPTASVGVNSYFGPSGEMYQGFPGDPDNGSRGSSSPSIESQYLSSVDSFGSPPTTSAPQVGQSGELHIPHVLEEHHQPLQNKNTSNRKR